ncbi:hypothetical protein [Tropicimonas sp.]
MRSGAWEPRLAAASRHEGFPGNVVRIGKAVLYLMLGNLAAFVVLGLF